jgi:asparagine synthase (glutamine-hydrolysing)
MAHRGPDGEGIWQEGAAIVGHRRLAIVDLAASHQPMTDATGRYVLSYNGEVYNYADLRRGLEPRWRFRTQGDTEVVLAGLVLEGEGFFERMEGMWALVLWDRKREAALLARDRMGKKPLYYQTAKDVLACASELPALAHLAPEQWSEDPNSTADYFRFGYYLPGTTAYREVREVLPGHALKWRPSGTLEETPYWRLAIGGAPPPNPHQELRQRLVAAVRRRLVADVEVGAFLSGGIDSSLVVSILTEELGVHPKTFTIGFENRTYDERPFARVMAERCGTDHFEDVLANWDRSTLERLIQDHVGQPFQDSSLLPTALVSEVAARRVKVALSGDGGDEVFSGYQRYQARAILRWYARLPASLRQNIGKLIRSLPEPMSHHSRSLLKKAVLFQNVVDRFEDERPYVAPLLYSNRDLRALIPDIAESGHRPPGLPEESRADGILEMMAGDAMVYLPQDILAKVDRASMAHSLESRAPFLDTGVVELAFSLPRRQHRRGIRGKRMLRETFADRLPSDIWSRRKQGFGVPIHQWFREALGEQLEELLDRHTSPIAPDQVRAMLAAHRQGARDHGYRLWGIYVYLYWREQRPWRRS